MWSFSKNSAKPRMQIWWWWCIIHYLHDQKKKKKENIECRWENPKICEKEFGEYKKNAPFAIIRMWTTVSAWCWDAVRQAIVALSLSEQIVQPTTSTITIILWCDSLSLFLSLDLYLPHTHLPLLCSFQFILCLYLNVFISLTHSLSLPFIYPFVLNWNTHTYIHRIASLMM